MLRQLISRTIVALTLVSLFAPAYSSFAQRRGTVASTRTVSASKCSGAWTGTITYTRTQTMSDNKTVERVSGRGQDTRNWEMKYDYNAQVRVIESPENNGSSVGKGKIAHDMTSTEKNTAVERNSCDRGKTWQDMRGTFTSQSKTSGSADVDANVSVGVNSDGTYSISVGLPQIQGQTAGSQSSTFSGQCTAKEGKTLTMPPTQTNIDGNSLTSDGTNRINPDDPDRLSGSYSKTWQNVTETITWTLQRCGGALQINDLKFEHMAFPNWDDWVAIQEQTGTTDGNFVKMKAKVLNTSGETKFAEIAFKETYKGDKWDGAKPDYPLKDSMVSVRLEPGEEREVEALWDTSGFAWYDDGRPRLVQRVKAEIWENNKKADELTSNIKIAPKPLVLVHGLRSNWKAWETWQNILTTSHSYDWKAFAVGEKPENGVMNTGGEFLSSAPTNTIAQNAAELKKYIDYAQRHRNAWHVDIVAHSMGGLISRSHINNLMPLQYADGRPQIAHLVMLGTPNMGSPCADVMGAAFDLLGKKVEAIRELRPSVVEQFNRVTTNRKGVKFAVLAGDPLPTMCKTIVWNDGVVPVPSAIWQIEDNARSGNIHTDLTGTADFSTFVKPRLAVGPRGDHNPAAPAMPKTTGQTFTFDRGETAYAIGSEFVFGGHGAAGVALAPEPLPETPFARSVKIAGNSSVEIEVPVASAANFGITFMAPPAVSATLVDAAGAVVGKNIAGSKESKAWFRSVFVDKPVTAGTWKLRLENTGDLQLEAVITTWADAAK